MSVAQILEEAKSLSVEELQALEVSLRLQRLQRTGKIALPEETRLLQIINRPMLHPERFASLTRKWENEGLSEEERGELMEMTAENETLNVERAKAVQKLSELQGVSFETLWKKMMSEAPAPLVPLS